MENYKKSSAYNNQLSTYEFKRISKFIEGNYGIQLPDHKRIMVQGRLQKRLIALELDNFKDYVGFLFSEDGREKEIPMMVDLISTNKTNFFREAPHFKVLNEVVFPAYLNKINFSTLKVWSAGCSSGEEVYTLSMLINEFFGNKKNYRFKVMGSDISHDMLRKASAAIYDLKDVATIPLYLKQKYLLKHKDKNIKTVRIAPHLRSHTKFMHLNFMDEKYELDDIYDIVFCRNVIIYFDRKTQIEVIRKILEHLKPGGYLFLGHSESINNTGLPINKISSTVFQKHKKV